MSLPPKSAVPPQEILIAEDSPTQAQRLQHILEQQGFRVTAAANGRQALQAARSRRPTLIISDIIMPEMDGYELCRRVKSDDALGEVPVILVTTLSDPQDVIRGLENRADNFILKPYDERHLINHVQFVLVNREMRQTERSGMGVEIFFNGQKHFITADRLQILNLLLSTYEAAMQRNKELSRTQDTLWQTNSELQRMTLELEHRVAERTQDLERANRSLRQEIAERKLAEDRVQAQVIRLGLLHQITRAIGERQDLPSIFQVVVRSLEDHLPIDFGCVFLCDATKNTLRVASVGVKCPALAQELAAPEQACINVAQNRLAQCMQGQLVCEPDISQAGLPFPQRLAQSGLLSVVFAPLMVESNVFGVLVAARREVRSFSSPDCEFLRQLSEHVGLASHQAQLYGALQQAYEELRQTQEAAMQQERLSALGQMASGIAHDINNAVSPVALYTESLLENEPNLSARSRAYLETIARAIDDVAATVGRMREFYRPREPQMKLLPANLNELAEQVVGLTRARWCDMPQRRGISIKMRTDFAADIPDVSGVESEIREALTNLIFNAVDAMTEGGTITLRTRLAEVPPAGADIPAMQRVCLEVIDTGSGMDEETRRRCLEPFFTTKGERGTGLGLAMVYGMAQRHSAAIEIESAVGNGTIMRLSFPLPSTVAVQAASSETVQAVPPRLRILVVDDDPVLLKSLCSALEADGHVVIVANSGQAGTEAFRSSRDDGHDPIDLVITDLGMPDVDGRKVASSVKSASPRTPVILLTGWGQGLFADGDVPAHVDRVLNKPPKLHELRQALAHCCQPSKC